MKKLILFFSFFSSIFSMAQTNVPILERKVTVRLNNQSIGRVMEIVSETANFSFSYNSGIIKTSDWLT